MIIVTPSPPILQAGIFSNYFHFILVKGRSLSTVKNIVLILLTATDVDSLCSIKNHFDEQ